MKIRYYLESLLFLSPLFLVSGIIFNFVDTKFFLSRLIVLVCLYCLFFYRKACVDNLKNQHFKQFVIMSLLVFAYFAVLRLVRGDEFAFARTLIASVAYLLFVPWNRINRNWFYVVMVFSGLITGVNAYYEHHVLGIARVGIAVNPIPFSLFAATLVLMCSFIMAQGKLIPLWVRICAFLGAVGSGYAVLLTDARGVWIALPIAMLVLFFSKIRNKNNVKWVLVACSLLVVFGMLAKPDVEKRWDRTVSEYQLVNKGNMNSSIGVRLTLWKNGLEFSKENILAGVGDDRLIELIKGIKNNPVKRFSHLHNQYIDTLVRYGAIAVILISMWILSIHFYYSEGRIVSTKSSITISFIVLVAIASLTDVHMMHAHVVYLIAMLGGVLCFTYKDGESLFPKFKQHSP